MFAFDVSNLGVGLHCEGECIIIRGRWRKQWAASRTSRTSVRCGGCPRSGTMSRSRNEVRPSRNHQVREPNEFLLRRRRGHGMGGLRSGCQSVTRLPFILGLKWMSCSESISRDQASERSECIWIVVPLCGIFSSPQITNYRSLLRRCS